MKTTLILLCACLVACGPEVKTDYSGSPRFTAVNLDDGLYILKDTQTGKEYLHNFWHGGFIEIEPTKP